MQPNHVLRELELLDATAAVAFEPASLDLLDGHSGRTLLSADLQGAHERYGAPYLNIHRGDLQKVLLDALTSGFLVRSNSIGVLSA